MSTPTVPTNSWFHGLPGPRLQKVVDEKGGALKERYHTDDVWFAIWLHTLNQSVMRRTGFHFDDLEDWGYRDAYDADMSPREAALQMLEDNDYEVGVF